MDDEATKPAVVEAMRGSDVVHLATHGEPEGLFFAGGSAAEATLSMAEVHALELRRAPLVVLSACDTFKGELRSDGVVGITRAFVAAGAPTLAASLWPVSDAATLELMRRFYAALLRKRGGGGGGGRVHGAAVGRVRRVRARGRARVRPTASRL